MRIGNHVFKDALILWMQDKRVTQIEISKMCNVSQALVGKWISGTAQSMSRECFEILQPHIEKYIESGVMFFHTDLKTMKQKEKDFEVTDNHELYELDRTIPDMIKQYFEKKNVDPPEAMKKYNLSLQSLAVIFEDKSQSSLNSQELAKMKDLLIELWNDLFKDA